MGQGRSAPGRRSRRRRTSTAAPARPPGRARTNSITPAVSFSSSFTSCAECRARRTPCRRRRGCPSRAESRRRSRRRSRRGRPCACVPAGDRAAQAEHDVLDRQPGDLEPVELRRRQREHRQVEAAASRTSWAISARAADVAHADLDSRVVVAEGRQEAGNAERLHRLRLHHPERDRAAQPRADLSHGVLGAGRPPRARGAPPAAAPGRRRSATLRALRGPDSLAPSSRSSASTAAETEDWTRCRRSAARVKLPSSATATNARSWRDLHVAMLSADRDS